MTPPLIEGECYEWAQETPVYVRLGVPAPDPASTGDFYCPVEVLTHKTGEMLLYTEAFGINALQAVENAFLCVRQRWPIIFDPNLRSVCDS
ncbi:hypothetical protein [Ruegeria sp. EL01]|uniref:hypothetical protein n=1 Tax=Ruegeria sp. EL01 TaxID=2107578 RepID=UPI0013C51AB1|nr:hypothetical protein [Ruegeria sp. EL01]